MALAVCALAAGEAVAQATVSGRVDPALEARAQELAAITADRSRVVQDVVDHWRSSLRPANPALNDDGGLAELTAALSAASPEVLLAAKGAQSYEELTSLLPARAQTPSVVLLEPGQPIPNALGSSSGDLVFTPITPCRVFDSRIAAGGWNAKVGPNSGNWFSVHLSDFTVQGGAASCPGLPTSFTPAALALNLTSTGQTGLGNLRLVQCGGGVPTVSLLNYTPGVNLANAAISPAANCALGPPAGVGPNDIFVYSTNSASDVVVDIMGYFAAPVATALECYTTAATTVTVAAGGIISAFPPACAAGYGQVSVGCRSAAYDSANWAIIGYYVPGTGGGSCWGTNTTAASHDYQAFGRCCRVPGR